MADEMTQGQDIDIDIDIEDIDIDLYTIVKDTCEATGTLDIDQIIARLTKNADTETVVVEALGLDEFSPEQILRHLIDDLVKPEDRLVWEFGISPEVAAAIVAMREVNGAQRRAEMALLEVIGDDLNSACQRVWDETHETDEIVAARAMLGSIPAIAEGLREMEIDLTEQISQYYAGFIAEQQREGGEPVSSSTAADGT